MAKEKIPIWEIAIIILLLVIIFNPNIGVGSIDKILNITYEDVRSRIFEEESDGGFQINIGQPNIPSIASCGDGVKAGVEECDLTDFGGISCRNLGFDSGILRCDMDGDNPGIDKCIYDDSGCINET